MNDADRPHAIIRFRRDVSFPKFSMKIGERWSFVVYGKWEKILAEIRAGNRFPFAGGMCLAEDVDIIYEGLLGPEYSLAFGESGRPCSAELAETMQ